MVEPASSTGSDLKSVSTILEKASEFRYYLLIMAAILTLDNFLSFSYKKNILSLGSFFNTPELTLGNTIIYIALVTYLLALFFPVMRRIILILISSIYYFLEYKLSFLPNKADSDRAYKYAPLVENKAILDRDEFDLKLVSEHNDIQRRIEGNLELGFAVATLLIFNFWILGEAGSPTVSQILITALSEPMGTAKKLIFYLFYGVFIIGISVVLFVSLNPVRNQKMYLPKSDDYPKLPNPPTIGSPPVRRDQ